MTIFRVADYASPQDALDAAALDPGPGRSVVVFDPVLYELPAELRVRGNLTIEATGAYLRATGGNHRLLRNYVATDSFGAYAGHGDITLRGGTWDANGTGAASGTVANAIAFLHCSNIDIVGVEVLDVAGAHGIELNAVRGARVRDCTFRGFLDTGDRAHSEAIQIDGAWSAASADIGLWDDTPCRDVSISGCRMGSSAQLGPYGALAGGHAMASGIHHRYIRVTDCHVEGSLQHGFRPYGWAFFIVSECTVASTAGTAIVVQRCRDGVITTCPIDSPGSNGINVSSSERIVVDGCPVRDPSPNWGVWVGAAPGYGPSEDILVTSNLISGAMAGGMKLATGTDRAVLLDNLIRRDGGGSTGVVVATGAGTASRVEDNDIRGFVPAVDVQSGTVSTE